MKKQTVAPDRLSALPDAIIFLIFSFLDMRVVVQTSILSNRWRYLWSSTPVLNFHLDTCKKPKKLNRNRFINFVDRVLLLRSEGCNIHTFNLRCSYEKLEADRIYTWVIAALKSNLEELHLRIYCNDFNAFPYSLFASKNISVLKLDVGVNSIIILPDAICSNNRITSLELVSFRLPKGNSNGELSLSFAVLKNLVIRGGCLDGQLKSFTISAPQLERLEVAYLFGNWSLSGKWNLPNKVNICTPKLKLLIYTGFIYGDYFLENLSALVSAELYIWKMLEVEEQRFARYVSNVLNGIYNVEKLIMPSFVVQTITDSPRILELLPNLFLKMRRIELVDWNLTNDTCIHAIARFLERLTHIETFVWSRKSEEMELGPTNNGENRMNSSLKTIEIQNSLGSRDELKMLEILLRKSLVLKQIIIKASKSLLLDGNKLSEFREKLLDLPRASSSVKMSFLSRS